MDTPFFTRRLSVSDLPLIRAHLGALAPEDLVLRFFRPMGPSALDAHCAGLDFKRGAFFGSFDPGRDELLALSEVFPSESGAEIALSCLPSARAQGRGKALALRAIDFARLCGSPEARIIFMRDNESMRRLALSLGMNLASIGPETEGRLPLAAGHLALALKGLSQDLACIGAAGAGALAAAFPLQQASWQP